VKVAAGVFTLAMITGKPRGGHLPLSNPGSLSSGAHDLRSRLEARCSPKPCVSSVIFLSYVYLCGVCPGFYFLLIVVFLFSLVFIWVYLCRVTMLTLTPPSSQLFSPIQLDRELLDLLVQECPPF